MLYGIFITLIDIGALNHNSYGVDIIGQLMRRSHHQFVRLLNSDTLYHKKKPHMLNELMVDCAVTNKIINYLLILHSHWSYYL